MDVMAIVSINDEPRNILQLTAIVESMQAWLTRLSFPQHGIFLQKATPTRQTQAPLHDSVPSGMEGILFRHPRGGFLIGDHHANHLRN